jgi:hypothetical protein
LPTRNRDRKPLVVATARAVAVLVHAKQRRILFAFVDHDRSLAEVARMTELPLNLLHYHVLRMVDAGLLVRRDRRVRAGRPVQLYRAAASAFLVAAESMPESPDAALHRELRQTLERQPGDGYLFSHEDGRVRIAKTGAGQSGELWRVLRLDARSARKLTAELGQLISSYAKAGTARTATKPYLVHVAVVPRRG